MTIQEFIRRMPKVELHVHLEGSIPPATLLQLAKRNHVSLPAQTVEELQNWYQFSGFPHFIEIYLAICNCIRTPDDLELVATEFLKDRASQNIRYSEVIFTPFTHINNIPLDDQLAAINRARTWAEKELGVRINLAPDLAREMRPVEDSYIIADWAVKNRNNGIVALGLGGPEVNNPPEVFASTFQRIQPAGLPATPHAGETEGPSSMWGAINTLKAVRLGHGVRCLEDPALVAYLREKQIPLEVCPSSNVCLGVAPSLAEHPLPKLMAEGLFITINSDDPPMFNTTLTDEYLRITETFGYDIHQIQQFVFNGIHASLLPEDEKQTMHVDFFNQFTSLRKELGLSE
jgi:aminodeoxyfutalosine deaminase